MSNRTAVITTLYLVYYTGVEGGNERVFGVISPHTNLDNPIRAVAMHMSCCDESKLPFWRISRAMVTITKFYLVTGDVRN